MTAKKDFKTPAEAFISAADEEKAPEEKKKTVTRKKTPAVDVPKGYRLVKEGKSVRMTIIVRPATKEALADEALYQSRSVNDLINEILEKYLERIHRL